MKTFKKITDVIAKAAEIICMVMIAALVVIIVLELIRRNFFNKSYRGTVELCGIAFLWMAFIGLIPLYHDHGLMRLDFLVSRLKGPVGEAVYYINKAFSLMLGIVMVVAFVAQAPYIGTRTYSTFSIPVPYTIQYVPMALAGAYIAVTTVYQVLDHVFARGETAEG